MHIFGVKSEADDLGPNWTVLSRSGRFWVKVDDLGSKWTIWGQSGRSIFKSSSSHRPVEFLQFKSNDRPLWPMSVQFGSKYRLLWPVIARFGKCLGCERSFTYRRTVHFRLDSIFDIKKHTFGITDFISSFFIVTVWTINQKCDVHRFEFSWWWNNFLAFTIVIYFQIVQVCQGCDLNWPLFDLVSTIPTCLDLRINC